MNYFAHLFFSRPTPESRVGNLLGDFARGLDREALPPSVRAALEQHYWIDRFTDSHPEVVAARRLFSPERRRFAGIALDLLFDHFLLLDWHRYSEKDQDCFIDQVYEDLLSGKELMPIRMRVVAERMVSDDWFRAYRSLEMVGFALDRIAERIRFNNAFAGSIAEIEESYTALHGHFTAFFPDLLQAQNCRY